MLMGLCSCNTKSWRKDMITRWIFRTEYQLTLKFRQTICFTPLLYNNCFKLLISSYLSISLFWDYIILYSLLFPGTWSVKMHGLIVPPEIRNDSRSFVVLDCQYSLNHTEKDGMILKWYLNGITIYQWIPPARPQVGSQFFCNICTAIYIQFKL